MNTSNLSNKMQTVIDSICANLCYTDDDMKRDNVDMRTMQALAKRGIVDLDYDILDGQISLFADFTTEAHKHYYNSSEVYQNTTMYDENGNTKIAKKNEEKTEVVKYSDDQTVEIGDKVLTNKNFYGYVVEIFYHIILGSPRKCAVIQYADFWDSNKPQNLYTWETIGTLVPCFNQVSEFSKFEIGDSVFYNNAVWFIVDFAGNDAVLQSAFLVIPGWRYMVTNVNNLALVHNQDQDYANWLSDLEGQEILSLIYEGCVSVKNGSVWRLGECIDSSPTLDTIRALFEEMLYNEFGG